MVFKFRKICSRLPVIILATASAVVPAMVSAQETRTIADGSNYVLRLGEPCGGGEWVQTSGPSSAYVNNSKNQSDYISYAKLYDSGLYNFQSTACCAAGNNGAALVARQATPNLTLDRISGLLSSPDLVGFGGKTTGGAKAKNYTVVTNLNDSGSGTLREALEERGPRWITFADSVQGGTINLRSALHMEYPNITIDGAGSGITISARGNGNFPMFFVKAGNTIFHGITLDGRGFKGTGIALREGKNYWIDHVTATNFDYDDAISVGRGSRPDTSASEVTVSNYYAHDTNYAYIGGGNNDVKYYPRHRVTIHSSVLSAEDRNPRIKNYGTAHLFNNYIHSFRFSGATSGANSVMYSENNVLSALSAKNPKAAMVGNGYGNMENGGKEGVVFSSGDMFLDRSTSSGQVRMVGKAPFNLPYRYTLRDTYQVIDYVLANAGASNAVRKGSPLRNGNTAAVTTTRGNTMCDAQERSIRILKNNRN